jgi:hypothetical protein
LYIGREKEYSYADSYSYLSELTVRLNPDKIDPKYLPETIEPKELIIASSTDGSTKRFKITVTDDGAITANEVV